MVVIVGECGSIFGRVWYFSLVGMVCLFGGMVVLFGGCGSFLSFLSANPHL